MRNNDELLKIRHYREAIDTAERRQNEVKLKPGIGHVVIGSIHDCNKKSFEKALKTYWDRLFVGWNPYKNDGNGCWEVWQKPLHKAQLSNFEHWVADLPFLRMDFIDDLRRMDDWEYKKNVGRSRVDDMDRAYVDYEIGLDKQEDELIKYAVRHNKSAFGKLKGLAQDGINPFWFLSDKKQGNGIV